MRKEIEKKIDENTKIVIEMRFDDECKNGHDTFAITGTIYHKPSYRDFFNKKRDWVCCGCMHDEIREHAPEYAKYIKWHLCSTDGPMHYVANTLHHAGDRDCWGKRKGEPKGYDKRVRFKGFPVSFALPTKFIESLSELDTTIVEVRHTATDYKYLPRYTFASYPVERWSDCPFDDKNEAEEMAQAFNTYEYEVIEIPYGYSEGKERDLDAARETAIWEDATDEELCLPPEQLKAKLEARLPKLLEDFKHDMEELFGEEK